MSLRSALRPFTHKHIAAGFVVGATAGGAAVLFYQHHTFEEEREQLLARIRKYDKKIKKLIKSGQEVIEFGDAEGGVEVLGLSPRLWMEVLDNKHRYAGLLYHYWKRWELSDTRDSFFPWLEHGQGTLIDLPQAPRRLLSEWEVVYLTRDQQPLLRVVIDDNGRFIWAFDGTPVTAPNPNKLRILMAANAGTPCPGSTRRENALYKMKIPGLARAVLRDDLLAAARDQVVQAQNNNEAPTPSRLTEIAAPLIKEGLLCQLRDPFFHDRIEAALEPEGHNHLRVMRKLPEELLPDRTWQDFIKAIDHDEGHFMKEAFPSGHERLEDCKGMFVLDAYGQLYCGTKFRGMFHHSSFTRGHCVKVAGVLKIVDGKLIELAPHSGHYQPSQKQIDRMIEDWQEKGVDFSQVVLKPYMKNA